MKKNLLIILIAAIPSLSSFGQHPGKLDSSFGINGIVTTNIDSAAESAYAVSLQKDGKIVVAGYAFKNNDDFAVARYHPDGSLDTSFNKKGSVITHTGLNKNALKCMAIKKNGKIVAAGTSVPVSFPNFTVVQYNSNGILDTTFGKGGIVTTAIGPTYSIVSSMSVQTDSKIVVAGYSYPGTYADFTLVRYNDDGKLDTTFGGGGVVTTSLNIGDDIATSIAIQADGKIIVGGYTTSAGTYQDFALVRYHTNGSLDTSFSSDGKVISAWSTNVDRISAIALQTDGKIVVAGHAGQMTGADIAIARYNTNGSTDTSFSADGIQYFPLSKLDDNGGAICIQPNGRIIVTGWSNSKVAFNLMRFNSNGSIDYNWGDSGIVSNPSNPSGLASALVMQPDGKLVAVGYLNSPQQSLFAVVRYQTELSSGINEVKHHPFLIYPNPAGELITIHNPEGQLHLEIFDLTGRVIYQSVVEGTSANIDISRFEKGIYFMQVKAAEISQVQKFLKL